MARPLLVLDLDETLIHSCECPIIKPDLYIHTITEELSIQFYINFRPYLQPFLTTVSKWFDLVIFTASKQIYADQIIKVIDPNHYIKNCYYKHQCIQIDNYFVKDLSILKSDLARTVMIDDNPKILSSQVNNVIRITGWFGDSNDDELLKLIPKLEILANVLDVRYYIRANYEAFPVMMIAPIPFTFNVSLNDDSDEPDEPDKPDEPESLSKFW